MAKIFITGGLGYIGSALAQRLAKLGHSVMIYDSAIYEQDYSYLFWEKNIDMIVGDIRNTHLLEQSMREFSPDYVCHFAEFASVYAANHNPELTKYNNYFKSMEVLRVCENLGVKVIYNSSSSVYGVSPSEKPMKEDDTLPVPTDNYVKYKLMMEDYIKTLYNVNIITLRLATVMGVAPRMRIDLAPNHFTYMAVHKGEIPLFQYDSYRAFIDIEELVNAYMKIIEKGSWKHRIYNVGHYNMKKIDLAHEIRGITKASLTISTNEEDNRNLQIDCSRFNEEFNFHPSKPLRKTIKEVVKWSKEHPVITVSDLTMPLSEWERMCN